MDADRSEPVVINCWSGPRCVSTALMYAFAQRADTRVVDEPLYAHFLRLNPGLPRPYRDEVMAAQSADGDAVVEGLLTAAAQPPGRGVLYVKHMAKQRTGLGRELLRRGRHFLLVREPEAVVRSFSEVLEPTLQETCYASLLELYSELRSMGKSPPVVLSDDLVAAPEATLRALCAALAVPFDARMLSWQAGPRPEDGCWAPYWYKTTHASTGFGGANGTVDGGVESSAVAAGGAGRPLPPRLRPLLEECRPLYEFLRRRALRPRGAAAAGTCDTSPTSPPAAAQCARSGGDAERTLGQPEHVLEPQRQPQQLQQSRQQLRQEVPQAPPAAAAAPRGGTHAYAPDPRNADVLVGIRDGVTLSYDLVWRPEARVSVLDAGFMLGDGVWEGLRLHRGVLLFAAAHMARLYEGAKALDMDMGLTPEEVQELVYRCVDANAMTDGCHVRLMCTRGLKATPYQSPSVTLGSPTIVVIPEHKEPDPGPKERGIRLFTVHVRRGAPDVQDPAWNSHSKLNCIAACIQASKAGADEALMLDPRGFVATCNSTNFFCVRDGEVYCPGPQYQMAGITRGAVMALCRRAGVPLHEGDLTLTQVYSADEAFVTGTFAGQIPVVEVDGRRIGGGSRGPVTARLQAMYAALCDEEAARGRYAPRYRFG